MEAAILLKKSLISQEKKRQIVSIPNVQIFKFSSLSFSGKYVIIATPLPSESAQVNGTVPAEQVCSMLLDEEG